MWSCSKEAASMPDRCLAFILLLGPLFVGSASPLSAQELRLGEVNFANSGSPEAHEDFDRGLLLLHSFEYEPAARAFREAQETDPDFAMAYWGEAMTYNHPVWMQQDREAALEALDRFAPTPGARAEKAGPQGGGTEREAAYMRAVDILYGDGDKKSRDFAYAEAMATLHEEYPEDEDAAAFHALAILGKAHDGRDFGIYMKAAGILEQMVDGYPGHPGIAHYLIHSYDDPIHAPLGIRAAQAYSGIAPDAPHAQHMTSHIFLALGMWDAVVEANENAMRVVNAERAARGLPPGACGHYNYWLEYGYLQQGREADARRLLRECYAFIIEESGEAPPEPGGAVGYYARMLARYAIDAGEAPVGWPIDLSNAPGARVTAAFAEGYSAAMRGDAEGLRASLAAFDGLSSSSGPLTETPTREEVLEMELRALQHWREGEREAAIDLARKAAEAEASMPFEFGPPFIEKPAYELLGELLLEAGRVAEARAAFETALDRTPNRAAVWTGLKAATAASGE